MRNERLDSTKTFSKRTEPHALQKTPGAVEAAEVNSDHSAKARHLFLGQFVARMIRQSGIVNLLHFFFTREKVRDGDAIRIVRFHPYRQRLDSAHHKPGIKRRENGTCRVLNELKPVGIILTF